MNIAQIRPAVVSQPAKTPKAIQPLTSPDQIYVAEDKVINSTKPGQGLYITEYSLPKVDDGPSIGTQGSDAQRQILKDLVAAVKRHVAVYVVTDHRAGKHGSPAHNQSSIDYLRKMGAYVLPYPSKFVSIDHSKVVANNNQAVVSSANWSAHQSDSPDNNAGFVLTGAAAHNGVVHSFLPQWNFAAQQDTSGVAANYPAPNVNPKLLPDKNVTWLNTAPAAESGSDKDSTEIKQAYLNLIHKAASGAQGNYLYLEQFDVTNPDIVHALVQAKQQNPSLDVRVIEDPGQYRWAESMAKNSGREPAAVKSFQELTKAGIPVRFANVNPHPPGPEGRFPQQFHDKWISTADEIVNGSGNLSEAGMDPDNGSGYLHNREVDVDVTDRASAKAYKQKFLSDWGNTSPDATTAAKDGK